MTDRTERKRVVFVLPALTAGGAERVLITLMNGLDRSAFDPVFLALNGTGPLRDIIDPDIPFDAVTKNRCVACAAPGLFRKLRARAPDIVVSTMAHMNFLVLLLRPFFPHTRFVVREAITPSFILRKRSLTAPLVRFLYRRFYPKADLVVSPAQVIVDEFQKDLGIETDNHVVLPNPVDIEKIRAPANFPERTGGPVHFVCAGRLHGQKGFDRLIENIPPEMDFRLLILGEGEERRNLEQLIKGKGLTGRISLPGLERRPWPFYGAADAFLLPSRWEGLPNVALEALACGTRVIAMAEAGGIREIAAAASPGAVTVVKDMDEFVAAMRAVKPAPAAGFRPSLLPEIYEGRTVCRQFAALLKSRI